MHTGQGIPFEDTLSFKVSWAVWTYDPAALCFALVISKSSLSKVTDQQVEIMGHGTIRDEGVA